MGDYDDEVAKQPKRRLSAVEAQQSRYGSRLDEQRHIVRRTITDYARWISGAMAVAVGVAEIWKVWRGG